MSTRANFLIIEKGLPFESQKVYLYRHFDGYPSSVLPTIKASLDIAKKSNVDRFNYQTMRAGYVASYLTIGTYIAQEIVAIEPTDQLHGDIEYLYVITLDNKKAEMVWALDIYCPKDSFWDNSTLDNCIKKVNNLPENLWTEKSGKYIQQRSGMVSISRIKNYKEQQPTN